MSEALDGLLAVRGWQEDVYRDIHRHPELSHHETRTAGIVDDDLAAIVPRPDVVFAQHVPPFAAGDVGTRTGPVLSAADSMRVVVHGRGGHGSMPQATVDPVLLASTIVVRLQAVVSREVPPTETAVLTVGSIRAGTKSNVIPDSAELLLNVRTNSEATRRGYSPPSSAS